MPRAGLSSGVVVEQACALADESGLDKLTLAAVAQRVGVALPSLYKHVGGLDDLRRRMAVVALGELRDAVTRATVGRAGGEALRALAGAYWEYAHQHPGRYLATLRAPDPDDAEARTVAGELLDVVYAVLGGYGIAGADAVDATRLLRAVLHGYVSLEGAGAFGMAREVRASFERAIGVLDTAFATWAARANGRPSA